MNTPYVIKIGDYVMSFPVERSGDRQTARDAMKRNGCKTIRFEIDPGGVLRAHGYVARMSGHEVESL